MIRDVVLHIANEQPLLADIYALPTAADAGLLCTRVRTTDGKRPVFIDHVDSTFFFPYRAIRFIEIPAASMSRAAAAGAPPEAHAPAAGRAAPDEAILLPVPVGSDGNGEDGELEIDEDFLQRIRDI